MKNILHVIDTTGPGGAETVFVQLATCLDAHKWQSFAAVPGRGWVYDTVAETGLQPIVTPCSGSFDLRYLVALCRAIRNHRIDLVQTHLFTASVYGSLAGTLCGVPVVSTFHGRPDLAGSERYRALKFRILRRGARKVVFVSESLRGYFSSLSGIESDRTVVIYNGIDVSAFAPRRDTSLRQELGIRNGEVLVGAVGNLRPAKGYDVFLRAAAVLARRQSPAYRFVIVGDADGSRYQDLLALRNDLALQDKVAFAGFRGAVHRVMNNLDLYVSTSSSEGFSLTLAEAMACGVPVVATRSGGPEEIITHNVDGFLVDTHSPEQVAQAIRRVWEEPATRERLAREGQKSVRTKFTREGMLRRYESLYELVTLTGVNGDLKLHKTP